MRITYRQLKMYLDKCSDEQLDCDCTVQIPDEEEGEFFGVDFRIINESDVLDANHPVLYVYDTNIERNDVRVTDQEVNTHIRAIEQAGGFDSMGT